MVKDLNVFNLTDYVVRSVEYELNLIRVMNWLTDWFTYLFCEWPRDRKMRVTNAMKRQFKERKFKLGFEYYL